MSRVQIADCRLQIGRLGTRDLQPAISNWLVVIVLLLAGALRFWQLDAVPPGWRDDELIELDIGSRIVAGWRPLYIEEAEGHEPLYHYIQAIALRLFGSSRLSYRWLSAANGLLAVALTMVLSRRLFGARVAFWSGALMAVGFWLLMYSRFGLRHVGVLPPTLLAFYALWRILESRAPTRPPLTFHASRFTFHASRFTFHASRFTWPAVAGFALAAALYTYFAGRVAPLIVAFFAVYLLLFHHATFKATWRGWLWAGVLMLILFAPLGWYLAHHPLETRLQVVGQPLLELLHGNPRPVLETTVGTLGMFTHTGDPEWLYNITNRPVFNLFGGVLLWAGFALCLYRWREPRYAFLALWFGLGLLPAFISIPAASLGHTILAQPAVYILPVLSLEAFLHSPHISRFTSHASRLTSHASHLASQVSRLTSPRFTFHVSRFTLYASLPILLTTTGFRDLRDYFAVWPRYGMVRFLYHADVADLARALRTRPDVQEIAVATISEELRLDATALAIDLGNADVRLRLFDPTFSLVVPAGHSAYVALTRYPPLHPAVASLMRDWPLVAEGPPTADGPAYRLYRAIGTPPEWGGCAPVDFGALQMMDCWVTPQNARPGQEIEISTLWQVEARDGLSPTLKFFFHLIAPDGHLVTTGDRISVWLPSLHPGDTFIQHAVIAVPADALPGDYAIQAGVYDETTGRRWEGNVHLGTVRLGQVP